MFSNASYISCRTLAPGTITAHVSANQNTEIASESRERLVYRCPFLSGDEALYCHTELIMWLSGWLICWQWPVSSSNNMSGCTTDFSWNFVCRQRGEVDAHPVFILDCEGNQKLVDSFDDSNVNNNAYGTSELCLALYFPMRISYRRLTSNRKSK